MEATSPEVKTRTRPCPICRASHSPAARISPYSRAPWDIIECHACAFVFLPVVPEHAELETNLAWEKSFVTEATRRKKKQPLLQWLDKTTRWRLNLIPAQEGVQILNAQAQSGPALDLGCGSGGHLANFDDRFSLHGVEISKVLAERAQVDLGHRGATIVQASSVDGLRSFKDNYFTAALLRSYLEHDWQAREVIEALHAKMAPGGMAVVKVPNYGSLNRRVMGKNWCGFRLPDHVNYFDKPSLRALAKNAGFEVRFPVLKSLPTDDNMIALLVKA